MFQKYTQHNNAQHNIHIIELIKRVYKYAVIIVWLVYNYNFIVFLILRAHNSNIEVYIMQNSSFYVIQ